MPLDSGDAEFEKQVDEVMQAVKLGTAGGNLGLFSAGKVKIVKGTVTKTYSKKVSDEARRRMAETETPSAAADPQFESDVLSLTNTVKPNTSPPRKFTRAEAEMVVRRHRAQQAQQ